MDPKDPLDEETGPHGYVEHRDGTWWMVDKYGTQSGPFKVVDGKAVEVDDDE